MVGDDDANSPIPEDMPGDAGVAGEPRDMVADVVGGGDAGPPEAEGGLQGGVPHEIMGKRAMRVKGRHDQAWSYYDRLSVRCKNPLHPACVNTRSLVMDRDVFGPRSAEFFSWALGCRRLTCQRAATSDMRQRGHMSGHTQHPSMLEDTGPAGRYENSAACAARMTQKAPTV